MTQRTKIILAILFIAIIVVVSVWVYAFDDGSIEVNTGLNNYKITVNGQTIVCSNDPCTIELKSEIYKISFEKDGYNSITSTAFVKKGEVTPVNLQPKKITVLTPSDIVKDIKKPKLPAPPNFGSKYTAIGYSWNENRDKYLFLDEEDSRLKILNKEGEIKLITVLKNIDSPIDFYWSANEKRILANKDNDFYFIDVELGSRKKQILDFEPENVLWSLENDYILLNDKENNLYSIDWDKQSYIEPLNEIINLSLSVWVSEDKLLLYKQDDEVNKTIISIYNPQTRTMEQLTQKFDFPVDDIYYDSALNTAFLHDSGENQWYKLEL